MTYSLNRNATEIACRYQARACRMAVRTARSSDAGRNDSTFSDASCRPNACSTSHKNRSRSLRPMDRQWAVTKATMSINSALGSGNSWAFDWGFMADHALAAQMNQGFTNVVSMQLTGDHPRAPQFMAVWPC